MLTLIKLWHLNILDFLVSTYEEELLAVEYALHKWSHFLLGQHFIIKTDHFSLKYLLDQKISTLIEVVNQAVGF